MKEQISQYNLNSFFIFVQSLFRVVIIKSSSNKSRNSFFLICVLIFRAVGHKVFGSLYREQILEKLRKSAEQCDCLQCFFVIHSMGGGRNHSFACKEVTCEWEFILQISVLFLDQAGMSSLFTLRHSINQRLRVQAPCAEKQPHNASHTVLGHIHSEPRVHSTHDVNWIYLIGICMLQCLYISS